MAHHHPPSPSGSSHRRHLSELLGEQQEPFYLDIYLLEKGCSPAFLDAAACGSGGGSCSTCWPRSRNTGGRLLRRPAARSKKRRGVLRMLLSRILSGTTTTTAAAPVAKKKKKRRQQPQPAAIGWRHANTDDEKPGPLPGRSEDAGLSTTPHVVERQQQRVEDRDVEREEEDDGDGEEEEDESSKKQLSPVSVLEQRLFEHSPPPHAQSKAAAVVLFSELLDAAACTPPTTLLSLLANAKQFTNSSKHGRRCSADGGGGGASTPPRTPRRFQKKKKNNHAAARREDTLMTPFECDLAAATAVVASELGGARVRPSDVGPEREDVAGDVAAAVLDALTEEVAAELMRMTTAMDQPWVVRGG